MRVNKKYNNRYIIKLNDKVVSRRNTRHLYNYCFLRIVKSEKLSKGFGIYHEVDKYYMPYWDKNHFNQTGNYTKKNPDIFKGVQKFEEVSGVKVINFKTTDLVKNITQGRA